MKYTEGEENCTTRIHSSINQAVSSGQLDHVWVETILQKEDPFKSIQHFKLKVMRHCDVRTSLFRVEVSK